MAPGLNEIAAGVVCLPLGISNVYLVGEPGSQWALVDTGVPGRARAIVQAVERRFGPGSRPEAIMLTHGHSDHAGNALDLAAAWEVPVFAHPLELPYLTGKSPYPPLDPTSPGFLSFLSRFTDAETCDLGTRVHALQPGPIRGMPGWEWLHTPGHTPGHVAFFRRHDATLIAGDAFATVDLDSAIAVVRRTRKVSRPPTPSTCDWLAAARSVRELDALNPLTLACGHGIPMTGAGAAYELEDLARNFPVPRRGRYVTQPVLADESGVRHIPPAPPDRSPGIVGAAGIAALAGVMFTIAAQRRAAGQRPAGS